MKDIIITIMILFVSVNIQAYQSCDIVISGGTLAALGAVIEAPTSAKVCLIQPTGRIGGQLGDQGVWHIDFNWLYQPEYPDKEIAYNNHNLHKFMQDISSYCNTGGCWVSRNCFMYSCVSNIIDQYLNPLIKNGNLTIFYNSMVKNVEKIGNIITSVTIIQREELKADCRPSNQRIQDWYSYGDNQYYNKTTLTLKVNRFLIEASQYGDVLVLSNSDYLQGTNRSNKCGQSIVFGVHQQYSIDSLTVSKSTNADDFSLAGYTIDQIWRYRRLVGKGINPKVGQISLQNWNGPGNDYRDGYLFLAQGQFSKYDWKGGINYTTIKQAQDRSIRFHQWFRDLSKLPLKATGKYFGTCNGVSKLPYVRDGRRSVGYKNFMIQQGDVTGKFIPNVKLISTPFADRLALGFYNMDIHSIKNCQYDSYPQNQPLPFFLPARAFTNIKASNLIVAGRAMAQQFYTSSATRTHTTELHSGIASMIMARFMIASRINSTWALIDCTQCIGELQQSIRQIMPIEWTINGKKYPQLFSQE